MWGVYSSGSLSFTAFSIKEVWEELIPVTLWVLQLSVLKRSVRSWFQWLRVLQMVVRRINCSTVHVFFSMSSLISCHVSACEGCQIPEITVLVFVAHSPYTCVSQIPCLLWRLVYCGKLNSYRHVIIFNQV